MKDNNIYKPSFAQHTKRKMKKVVLTLFIVLILTQVALATETTINVKTMPHEKVQIALCQPNTEDFQLIDRWEAFSDSYGDVTITGDISMNFDMVVFIKTVNDEKITSKKFQGDYSPGQVIDIQVAPEGFQFIESPEKADEPPAEENQIESAPEETPELSPETTETPEDIDPFASLTGEEETPTEPESKNLITTNAVKDLFKENKNILYYIIGAILLIIIIVVIIRVLLHHRKPKEKEIIVKKLSEIRSGKESLGANVEKKEDELKDLHEQLKSIQEEILNLKKEKSPEEHHEEVSKRIEEKKKQIMKEEQELLKLREEVGKKE